MWFLFFCASVVVAMEAEGAIREGHTFKRYFTTTEEACSLVPTTPWLIANDHWWAHEGLTGSTGDNGPDHKRPRIESLEAVVVFGMIRFRCQDTVPNSRLPHNEVRSQWPFFLRCPDGLVPDRELKVPWYDPEMDDTFRPNPDGTPYFDDTYFGGNHDPQAEGITGVPQEVLPQEIVRHSLYDRNADIVNQPDAFRTEVHPERKVWVGVCKEPTERIQHPINPGQPDCVDVDLKKGQGVQGYLTNSRSFELNAGRGAVSITQKFTKSQSAKISRDHPALKVENVYGGQYKVCGETPADDLRSVLTVLAFVSTVASPRKSKG